MTSTVTVRIEPPRQPEVERLLAGSSEYSFSLGYPPEACFLLDVGQLEQPGIRLFVARDESGAALGIAALVVGGHTDDEHAADFAGRGELKRMFVDERARGLGVAGRLLEAVEADAASRGVREIVLETGTLHLPAQALYAKHGYRVIPHFGPYVGEEYSVCMAKPLASHSADAEVASLHP
ncbi:GNAT family N-acetyltransferase [Agromyces mediolanus]|uniref:GNAT family N-acetyltransferase n=1 Tax=Agromyces mediolanus TaxID=41986 RepID=UPI001E5D9283|nr:GNAT family N-acetyltransferase [Agromyces mediolanus]MCD1570344.1 GNAT family N-acetyltransferase [Agromyces mediolanus]